jgi:putative ABC transport system permease protein
VGLRESVRLSWTNITSHKLRNVLAVLSVTIGIAAVIAVVTMSTGFQDALLTTLTKDLLRANMISVSVETGREGGQSLFGTDRVFSSRDVERVRQMPGVKAADVFAPVNGNPLKYDGRVLPGNVRITTSQEIIPVEAGAGRFVQGPGEVVISVAVAKTLCERLLAREADPGSTEEEQARQKEEIKKRCEHPGRTPEIAQRMLGQTVELKYLDREKKVHAEALQIVGIVKESEFISSQNSYVSVDYQGFTDTIDGQELPVYTGIIVSAVDTDQLEGVAQELKGYFDSYESDARKLLGDEKRIEVNTLTEIVNEIKRNFGQFTAWIGAVAVVALLVGMIGVMNIMLITVKERTREIGVMKATGATQGGVLKLFLTEAVFICLIGALFGIAAGIGLAELFNRLTVALFEMQESIPLVLVWDWYAIAVVTGIIVGIVSGLYPAWQAARVNPIEALRYE